MNAQYESEIKSVEHRPISKAEEAELLIDERWLLVRRVLATPGFQRADQLRKILLYTTRLAILRPDEPIREYEIACNVLGRRSDFDPGTDNIVRVQVSHLRRKLESFYTLEGANEHILLTIPKGGYSAAFEYVALRSEPTLPVASPALVVRNSQLATDPLAPVIVDTRQPPNRSWTLREITLLALLCSATLIFAVLYRVHSQPAVSNEIPSPVAANPLLIPLLGNHKSISVVLPDTSLMTIQNLLSQNVSVGDYITKFPQQSLARVSDPALREALEFLANRRNTSFAEASVAVSLIQNLTPLGAQVNLRYARDLHVNDFAENNLVILGSSRSNPWTSIFTDKTNFRFIENPGDHKFEFVNNSPAPGEQLLYLPDDTHNDLHVDYVDIAMLPNLTNSGYVLLFTGSDAQSNEAAVHFVLDGASSEDLKKLDHKKTPTSYELFLRGTHILGEAEDHFQIVAARFPGN